MIAFLRTASNGLNVERDRSRALDISISYWEKKGKVARIACFYFTFDQSSAEIWAKIWIPWLSEHFAALLHANFCISMIDYHQRFDSSAWMDTSLLSVVRRDYYLIEKWNRYFFRNGTEIHALTLFAIFPRERAPIPCTFDWHRLRYPVSFALKQYWIDTALLDLRLFVMHSPEVTANTLNFLVQSP